MANASDKNIPLRVLGFAGSLLIVTPEYNYAVPGVLKNAID